MQKYSQWVISHPSGARQIEQITRMAVFMVCDPSSLVAMECGHSANGLLTYVNNQCLGETTDGSAIGNYKHMSLTDKASAVSLDLLHVLQNWVELFARQKLGNAGGWKVIELLQVLRTVLLIFLNRRFISTTMKAFARSLRKKITKTIGSSNSASSAFTSPARRVTGSPSNSPGGASAGTGARASPLGGLSPLQTQGESVGERDDDDGGRETPTRKPRLVIPRVGLQGDANETVVGSSLWDFAAFALQWFYWLRPLLFTIHVARSPDVRKAPMGKQFTWSIWRNWLGLELLAVGLSMLVKSYQPPIASHKPTFSTTQGSSSPGATAAGSPAASPSLLLTTPLTTPAVDDERLAARIRLLGRSLLRDPFFEVVLRDTIKRRIVNGWVAQHLPLLGPLISVTANYFLELQKRCFFFVVGDGPS